MLYELLPATIMFLITVIFVTVLFIPILAFKKKSELVNFYWVGLWGFLVSIAALAGAQSTLMLLNYNADVFSQAILTGTTTAFIGFVMFAWFRLSGKALVVVAKSFKRKSTNA